MPSPLRRILFNALAVPLVTLGFSDTASGQSSVENIDWSSSFFATNKDSTEEALDAGDAAAEADVFPVEAQATALAPSSTAFDTARVMPRSLNEPLGLQLSSLK